MLGVSKPHESTTTTLPSLARSDSAERSASEIIFLGVFWLYLRGLGPSATPPPLNCGERVEPCTGVAGALLAERLGAATAHLGAGLGALRAGPAGGELGGDDLVHDGHVGLDAEHVVVEVDLAGILAGDVLEGDLRHLGHAPLGLDLTALRTEITPPLGPGTEPRTSSTLRSASDSTTSRLSVVTCSWPM